MIEDLKLKVASAVDLFFRNDSKLLRLRVYEAAVSHRIAFYLEQSLQTERRYSDMRLNIDCEYDKDLDNPKKGLDDQGIRPDVLVHKRSERSNNLVAIEIKKVRKSDRDYKKLEDLTGDSLNYKYRLGAFIYFPKDIPRIIWFVDGRLDPSGVWRWSEDAWHINR